MSAADLFKDYSDVDFRLRNTHIMIGREPYMVMSVEPDHDTNEAKSTVLHLRDSDGAEVKVKLGQLPLHTMSACPSGYYDGTWLARGPTRNRYQGIIRSSLWAVTKEGRVIADAGFEPRTTLKTLASQPRIRRQGKRPSGMLTRDIFINSEGEVLIRGKHRAEYLGENTVKLLTEPNPFLTHLLDNAKLTLKGQPQMELPIDMCAGRSE